MFFRKILDWFIGSEEKQYNQPMTNVAKKTYDRRRFKDDGFYRDSEDFYVEVLLRL